ncbi:AI-2E family transporter [Candidatus Berkelbacteria bacterium]|nr:AI-2E family transporter [Candidatus Berkelbacteria bacterium]
MSPSKQLVELSTWSIVKVFGLLFLVLLLWKILDIIALLFVTVILVAALSPIAGWMARNQIPRTLAVLLIYVVLFFLFAFLVTLLLPPLIEQIKALASTFPALVGSISPLYEFVLETNAQELLQSLSSGLSSFTQGVFSAAAQLFGGAISTLTVFVLSFYMLVEEKKTRDSLILLLPSDKVKPVVRLLDRIGDTLGRWLRGQMSLSVIMGILTFIGLAILNVQYALTLAVLAGIAEIVPVVGPVVAGGAAVLVAYASGSWQLAVAVLIFFIVLQQLEGHLLVPKVMESAVGLSPILVIIALAIGAKLAGVVGAVLAVPLAATLAVLLREWPRLTHSSP